jgi:Leucine-rich repeat (LRR) protein
VTLGIGDYPNPGYLGSLGNDNAESIRVGSNVQATLCEHDNYEGRCETFAGDDSNLGDNYIGANVVSSVKVQSRTPPGEWHVEYFNDKNLGGRCYEGYESTTYVFKDWGEDAPAGGCPNDNWSARFRRRVHFQSGSYTFALGSDDWARIYVGSDLVVDNWEGRGQHYESRYLNAGDYDVKVEFADTMGQAWVSAWWWGPGFNMPRESKDPNQWYAEYWGNKNLSWDSIIRVNEGTSLNHEWYANSPGWDLPDDRFSTRFEKTVNFACGRYRFHVFQDDGARVYIDDNLVPDLDHWQDGRSHYYAEVDLTAGSHTIRVDHYENTGWASIALDWQQLSPCPQPFSCDTVTEIPQAECKALVALYNSTNGDNWRNNSGWMDTNTPCSWYGVTCNAGRVISLDLEMNRLSGTIPPELGNLANLQVLSLYANQLSGGIPAELGNLTNLQYLRLYGNQLSGSIPPEWGSLMNLQVLQLADNQLSGSIPSELGNLVNLQDLWLGENQLSGNIPSELGNLVKLQALWLYDNQLTGGIPTELSNLTSLEFLQLGDNQLTGGIPPELGNLTNLEGLELGDNQLTGGIPPELGNLTNLQWLSLGDNQLTGGVPSELGNLVNLRDLYLDNNQLSGPLPGTLTNLTMLERFYFHDTDLCEPAEAAFQAWLASIPHLLSTGVTCPSEVVVSNIWVASGKPYRAEKLAVGSRYYIDRNYQITSIPSGFEGLTWIMTANDDKRATASSFLSFDINVDAWVYVAYDHRAKSLPEWLRSFTPLGQGIGVTDGGASPLMLHAKQFPPGKVTLGGNRAQGASGADSNYVVLVKAAAGGPHTVSIPNRPSGPSSGQLRQSLTYCTGGSVDSQGHSVQYRFDWGDGSYSHWSSSTCASHSWRDEGTYSVKAQARCSVNTSITSPWSDSKSVTIGEPSGEELEVTNIWVASGKPYRAEKLAVGSRYYIDRNYQITSIPSGFEGLTWIMTANDDKKATASSFLSFDINVDAWVYVAYDHRASSLPEWLRSFTPLGQGIGVTDGGASPLMLYGKQFSAGRVTLGGNRAQGASGADSNYVVLLKATGGTPSPELVISNIWVASGKPYRAERLAVGSRYYIDRNYQITSIPSGFEGLTWIMTANDDKRATASSFLSFDINVDAWVYVAYDHRATSLPEWLRSFTPLGQGIGVTDRGASPLMLYGKQFSAGRVTLGGNRAQGASGADSNYVVLLKAS